MKEEYSERTEYVTYKLGEVTYLPHYKHHSWYVRPGYPQYNDDLYQKDELLAAGAVAVNKFLWVRAAHGTPTGTKR